MSKAKEIKNLQDYEETKKQLVYFSSLESPGPDNVVDAIKSLVALESINSTHNDRLSQELEQLVNGLTEIYQKSSHTFASLNALMHYLKDIGLDATRKLDIQAYEKVFNEKVVKPYQEIQQQIESLEKQADPFVDETFGAVPPLPTPDENDKE